MYPNKHSTARRELPHSIQAEQAVLGTMLSNPAQIIPLVCRRISPEAFYVPSHRMIFKYASDLLSDQGTFDLITLTQYLREAGQLEKVGGPAYVTGLFTMITSPAILEYYVDIVAKKSLFRECVGVGEQIIDLAYNAQDEPLELSSFIRSSADKILRAAAGYGRLPPLRDIATMLGENRPQNPPELVDGLLHQGSKLIVGGSSKGRKTFCLLDLALSVATGSMWWGFQCSKGRVCYINFEIQESFLCQRVEDICKRKSISVAPDILMVWNLRGRSDGIENLIGEILVRLHGQGFALVIVDPIYKALGNRDENKAGDVASLCNQLEKVAVQTGAAIAFGAHYSKGNQAAKESIDRIGGSGVFGRDPDSILTMTAHQENDAFTIDATLRNLPPVDPFVVRWDWPLFVKDEMLDPKDLKKPRGRSNSQSGLEESFKMLLELLNERPLRYCDFKDQANLELGLKEKTFEKYFTLLRGRGRIVKVADGWTVNGDREN